MTLDRLAEVLAGFDDDPSIALFLRHAERPELPADSSGHSVSITDAGLEAAYAIGRALAGRIGAIHTSPIRRCVETARALGDDVVVDPMLGDPGPFVADVDRVWEDWKRLGHDAVLSRLVSGVDLIPGLHPIRATAERLGAHALGVAAHHPGVSVFVTHDVVLAPLAMSYLRRPFAHEDWPEFLEPFALAMRPGGVVGAYRSEPFIG